MAEAPKRRRKPRRDPGRGAQSEVTIIGAPSAPFGDVYHAFLRVSWPAALGAIIVVYLLLNALFAVAFWAFGGVANVRPGSFFDAFYFSVETMGTVGYGAMYPSSPAAHVIVIVESVTGLLVTALATGLVFSKFARATARVQFARNVVIAPMDGVPTLMVRVGNERSNLIVEATLRVVLVRTERTKEGVTFYRMHDLQLSRERSPAFTRSWTALHPITEASPLFGYTPEMVKEQEVELLVTIAGVDEISMQPMHARHRYYDEHILFGARHADVLTETPGGEIVLDLRRFHEIVPTDPTDGFPYPQGGAK